MSPHVPHMPPAAKESTAGVLIAMAYGVSSASLAFVNKAVLSSYEYDFPITLVAAQMLFTIVTLEILRALNAIAIPPFTLARGRSFLLPSVCYAVNSVLALSALSAMNIPMYGLIKRCSPLAILLLGSVMLGKGLPSRTTCLSVAMVTAGCIIAGYGDLAFDLAAYTYGFASVLSQSLYLLLVQMSRQSLSASETLHLNSYNTLPLLLLLWLLCGEWRGAVTQYHYTDPGFVLISSLVIVLGCLLNFLLFLCTLYNSALTTSLTGALKSIVQTLIGMFTFGGISLNVFTLSGIAINLSGGVLYTVAKYHETQRKLLANSKHHGGEEDTGKREEGRWEEGRTQAKTHSHTSKEHSKSNGHLPV